MRDRRSDLDADDVPVAWDERPIVGTRRGLPWWGAVLLGFGLAILAAFVDLKLQDQLTLLFKACYCIGAIGAVCAVQRRNLFGPMVQPPLILAVTVPGVVLLTSDLSASSDTLSILFEVVRPLIDGFPTMAVTTGVTVGTGFFRMYRERDPEARSRVRPTKSKPASKLPTAPRPAAAGTATERGRPKASRQTNQRPGATEPGTPDSRARPAPEDGVRRARGGRETGERERGAGKGRQPREPGARGSRKDYQSPRDNDGAPSNPAIRRAPQSGDPRGTDGPRRAPQRHPDTPPPRRRPWDEG